MRKELRRLERAAVEAHQVGTQWSTFWETHRHEVGILEPWDRRAYHRLVERLSYLVSCGDFDGTLPIDAGYGRPMDWEIDDLDSLPNPPPSLRYFWRGGMPETVPRPEPATNSLRL